MKKKSLPKIECEICGVKEPKILHHHHIIERTEVCTSNHDLNLVVICPNCHTKIHSGLVKVIGVFPSTRPPLGRTVVFEVNGKSNFPELDEAYFKPKSKAMKIYK